MEEFNLESFAKSLKNGLYEFMPQDTSAMRITSLLYNPIMHIGDKLVFELGNYNAETKTPYYHILEDAQVISKPYRGTARTKGSQGSIADIGKRDYGKVVVKIDSKGNQSIYQEYRKNVRGSRSLVGKATSFYTETREDGTVVKKKRNPNSKYYVNIHYHYIEKELDNIIVNSLCSEFNLKLGRKKIDKTAEVEMAHIFGDEIEIQSDYYASDEDDELYAY